LPVPPEIVAAIARRLADRAGLELPAWVVEARAAARIEALGLSPADYRALLEPPRGDGELDALIEAVRVGETRFFRHRAQIGVLAEVIAPALRAAGKRVVRVWSAGCSAGEEAYTLAIVLARALPGVQLVVTGTDVSADALAIAAGATYRASVLADVPDPWRDAFELDGDLARVRPELAALVRFERANLVDGVAPRGCDVVWCRNVLIYFTPAARRRVIDRLIAATTPGGCVFVGYSESLRDVPALDAVRAGEVVYYVRREAGDRRTPAAGIPIGRQPTPVAGTPRVVAVADDPWRDAIKTPAPTRLPIAPPTDDVLALRGHPDVRGVTAELMARLAIAGLRRLVIDLDGAELLGDELAPVLRRARAAAVAAHVELELRARRTGARRWLVRHGLAPNLGEDAP